VRRLHPRRYSRTAQYVATVGSPVVLAPIAHPKRAGLDRAVPGRASPRPARRLRYDHLPDRVRCRIRVDGVAAAPLPRGHRHQPQGLPPNLQRQSPHGAVTSGMAEGWVRYDTQPSSLSRSKQDCAGDLQVFRGQATRAYSLIRPPRTGFRRICCVPKSVTVARGAPGSSSRMCWAMPWCGRAVL